MCEEEPRKNVDWIPSQRCRQKKFPRSKKKIDENHRMCEVEPRKKSRVNSKLTLSPKKVSMHDGKKNAENHRMCEVEPRKKSVVDSKPTLSPKKVSANEEEKSIRFFSEIESLG